MALGLHGIGGGIWPTIWKNRLRHTGDWGSIQYRDTSQAGPWCRSLTVGKGWRCWGGWSRRDWTAVTQENAQGWLWCFGPWGKLSSLSRITSYPGCHFKTHLAPRWSLHWVSCWEGTDSEEGQLGSAALARLNSCQWVEVRSLSAAWCCALGRKCGFVALNSLFGKVFFPPEEIAPFLQSELATLTSRINMDNSSFFIQNINKNMLRTCVKN